MRSDVEEWVMAFMNKRSASMRRGGGNGTPRIEKPMVRFVTAKQEKRIEEIRAAFRPEPKQKVTLPKFSWDKTNDE